MREIIIASGVEIRDVGQGYNLRQFLKKEATASKVVGSTWTYPKGAKKFRRPYFAFAINSRLQRRDENGNKEPGTLAAIVDHGRTVAFLERGLPSDRKVSRAQRGFTGGAKANPRAFAARHNKKGVLIFIDGHAEVRGVYELIERNGRIIYPQQRVIWTPDPEEDPN